MKNIKEEYRMSKLILEHIGLDIDEERILSKSRDSEIVIQRALIAKYLRHTGYTLKSIGKLLNRDHATIIYLTKKYNGGQAYKSSFSYYNSQILESSIKNKIKEMILQKENYIKELEKKISITKIEMNDLMELSIFKLK